jgi:hypothetical protein
VANNPLDYDTSVIQMLGGKATLLNGGFLEIWTGSQPALDGALTGTKLARVGFSATAFGTATANAGTGTATANAISSGIALATGTAGYFAVLKSDDATVVGTGTVGTSGADLNMSSLSIVAGQVVACSAFTLTMAQSGG